MLIKTEVERMVDKFIEELRDPEKAFDNWYMTDAFNAFIGFNGCHDISTCPLREKDFYKESTSSNIIGISVIAEYMDPGYYYNDVIFNIKFTPAQLAEIKRITGEHNIG